jgi:hypothetical protein
MAQARRGPVPPRTPERLGLARPETRKGGRPGASGASSACPSREEGQRTLSGGSYQVHQPDAVDPVSLAISKSWNVDKWQIDLSWSGGTSPYTISYSTDASFQRGDRTLGANVTDVALTKDADSSANLECFTITDANGVSTAVEGSGSDPYPDIPAPTIQQDGRWWGDSVTLNGNYLDLNPSENFLGLAAQPMQASAVTDGGSGFATAATFPVPDDGRGTYAFASTHGQTVSTAAPPLVHLYPRGISAYSNIRCVVYAPSTGHVWVAADGKVDEIDLFQHDPAVVRSITTYTKPYLSQCTTDGRMLVVDGVAAVVEIDQINVGSGAVTLYANTTDTSHTPNFTRSILPVGIAIDPDGSAGYVADATGGDYASTAVRFPATNSSAITDSYGNWPYWKFPDPCGIEVGLSHQLFMGSVDAWIAYVTPPGSNPQSTATYYDQDTCDPATGICYTPYALIVDRDVSTSSMDRVFYNNLPWALAFNQNAITSRAESTPARYLGADVVAQAGGQLSVEPQFEYYVLGNAPKPVILNNANQSYPYRTSYQVADRVVRLTAQGWSGVQVHLRLIDPPDTSGYAPVGGWPAKGGKTAVPPYEAYDNDVWNDLSSNDWGLSATSPGTLSGPVLELNITPDSTGTATFYLKLPPRYAGDNWQVEVTKKSAGGVTIPNKIPSYSAIFTGWKRVFVEKDRMFRRGGLLAVDAAQGQSSLYVAKRWDAVNSTWVRAESLEVNDKVAVFDTGSPFEGAHDEGCIIGLDPTNDSTRWIVVTLGTLQCQGGFTLGRDYSCSVDTAGAWVFAVGTRSAALGVIHSQDGTIADTATNQVNGTGSAFYDADMRDIAQPFDDAFVQLIALRSGSGAVPYMPQEWFSATGNDTTLRQFHQLWFQNKSPMDPPNAEFNNPHNYFHLVGASSATTLDGLSWVNGFTYKLSDISYIFIGSINAQCGSCSAAQKANHAQETTAHELAHQFGVNSCDSEKHDLNNAWCGSTGGTCDNSTIGYEYCIMHSYNATYSIPMRTDGICHLDCDDLESQGAACGIPACSNGTSIRTDTDPE